MVKSRLNRRRPKIRRILGKVLLGITLLFLAFFIASNRFIFQESKNVLVIPLAIGTSAPTIIPLPTPTLIPTAVPSPTPIPKPAGYCLNVPVLFYHHVQPQTMASAKGQTSLSVDNVIFDRQMAYLSSSGYSSISVKQLADALSAHSALPSKSIAITFDDGYRDNFDYARPVLSKYGLHANLMLATGLVGGADYLTWDDVVQMKNEGWYFTDHTWSHYAVNHGSTDKIKYEIETAKQQIQDHTGQNVDIFTYPYGSTSNTG